LDARRHPRIHKLSEASNGDQVLVKTKRAYGRRIRLAHCSPVRCRLEGGFVHIDARSDRPERWVLGPVVGPAGHFQTRAAALGSIASRAAVGHTRAAGGAQLGGVPVAAPWLGLVLGSFVLPPIERADCCRNAAPRSRGRDRARAAIGILSAERARVAAVIGGRPAERRP